jgi:hypothetical protein
VTATPLWGIRTGELPQVCNSRGRERRISRIASSYFVLSNAPNQNLMKNGELGKRCGPCGRVRR